MNSSIGPFNFVRMDNPPPIPKPSVIVERQAGVDGQAVWYGGTHSHSHVTRTMVDVPNLVGAMNLFDAYHAAIGQTFPITWGGIVRPFNVLIEDVVPVDDGLRGVLMSVGGLNGLSFASLEVDWKLLPIALPATP